MLYPFVTFGFLNVTLTYLNLITMTVKTVNFVILIKNIFTK